MASPVKETKPHKPLPEPNSDFYEFAADLPAEELAIVKKVRSYMETKVQPIINKYWVEDSFPFELLRCLSATTCLDCSMASRRRSLSNLGN